jgi:hypothetical protein
MTREWECNGHAGGSTADGNTGGVYTYASVPMHVYTHAPHLVLWSHLRSTYNKKSAIPTLPAIIPVLPALACETNTCNTCENAPLG